MHNIFKVHGALGKIDSVWFDAFLRLLLETFGYMLVGAGVQYIHRFDAGGKSFSKHIVRYIYIQRRPQPKGVYSSTELS